MQFHKVLSELQKNKIASRDAWDKTCEYIVLMPGVAYIWKILTNPQANVNNWVPSFEELTATDWKIIDKLPPKETAVPA